jgi:hypothetical protein
VGRGAVPLPEPQPSPKSPKASVPMTAFVEDHHEIVAPLALGELDVRQLTWLNDFDWSCDK